jgi:hypothetical protein
LVQRVQDGTVSTGSVVSLSNVFVTAVKVATNNNVTLVVQEPEGVTSSDHVYPEYAGVTVFVTSAEAGGLGALGSISPGDCISLTGTTSEFESTTEIVTLTALSKTGSAASCGTFPTPLAVPSTDVQDADVFTDVDGVTAGDQAGAKAEVYESVLVSFSNVSVTVASSTQFRVKPTGSPTLATMLIDPFLYTFTAPAVSMAYSHLTGIYTEFGTSNPSFRLQPRGATDLQP